MRQSLEIAPDAERPLVAHNRSGAVHVRFWPKADVERSFNRFEVVLVEALCLGQQLFS